MANIRSSDPTNNCATHFGSRSLFVSKVANACPNRQGSFLPVQGENPGNEVDLAPFFGLLLLKPHANGRNNVGFHMLCPFAHPPCCMLLHKV